MTWRPALWLVALLVVVIDQVTKQWALATLVPGEKIPLIGDFLSLQLVFNSGAAFSFGSDHTWFMTVIALAVTVGIVIYARRAQSTAAMWLFGIGLGGAIGNLIDRIFRDPSFGEGHVVDMINYNGWFVGNVADIAIVGAAAVALVMAFTHHELLAEPHPADADGAEPPDDPEHGEAPSAPSAPSPSAAAPDGPQRA
ncbi:signal peptidase II [Demequina sp.]|uniref:signal peptidase II n=1 Tax=Demequina sp. TaxID=2050685 RepID=UPI003A887C3F